MVTIMQFQYFILVLVGLSLASAIALPSNELLIEEKEVIRERERVHGLTGSAPATRKRVVTAYDAPRDKVNGYMGIDENHQVFIDGHKVS
jgi:hypothetical protein